MKLMMIMTLIIVTMTKCDLKKKILSEHDDHVFGFFFLLNFSNILLPLNQSLILVI